MNDISEVVVEAPTTWFPLQPTPAQASSLARYALHVDELSMTIRAWRAQARDGLRLLPDSAPFPGPLASKLRRIAEHPWEPLVPRGLENAWIKCDDELPVTQSLSDRGLSFAVCSLISDAMIAAGMAHAGQPLMSVDHPSTRAWLSEHELMIRGPSQDILVAGRICRALGLPAKAIRRSDTPQTMLDAVRDCGVQFTEPMTSFGAQQLKRQLSGPSSRVWWLDTTESISALKGYACAAIELKHQMLSLEIRPSLRRPLVVFLSSSNCLGAAGLIRGLKAVFGPYVQTVLVEDIHHLQALPTLCRWPKDPEEDRLIDYSEMGTTALVGAVDAVITVDDEHRQQICSKLPAGTQAQLGEEKVSLFAAAAEHLRRSGDTQSHVILWLSNRTLN